MYIQSWTKVLVPLELFQKMHHFSQKSVAITNVLVYTLCIPIENCKLQHVLSYPLSALGQHNKAEEKIQVWHNFTQNSNIGSDKIIGTLNLIFGYTPFGENNWNRSLPVTINKFPSPLSWTFFANCSRSLRFEGCLLATAILRSFHRCSMGFRFRLVAGHFRILQHFVSNHF